MSVLLRPLSTVEPLAIDDAEYQRLSLRRDDGWSHCADEREWLVKLHYLRSGYRAGKLERSDFLGREERLVTAWLSKAL